MPQVTGVLETSLYVDDVGRSLDFYRGLFGFPTLIEDERFAALDVGGRQVLLLFRKGSSLAPTVVPGGSIPPHDGDGQLHLAFSIPAADLEAWTRRVEVESTVDWPRGGRSIYFRDPDGHLLELVTPGCWPTY